MTTNLSSVNTAVSGIRTEPTENELRSAQLWNGVYTDPDRDNKYYTLVKPMMAGGSLKLRDVPLATCATGKDWNELVENRPAPAMWIDGYLRESTEEEIKDAKARAAN